MTGSDMGSRRRFAGPLLCWAGFAAAAGAGFAQNPAEQLETPSVRVIGVTPLPGFGIPAEQIPANVQAITGEEISRQRSINLPEFMNQRLPGVNVNEPFGDTVNWDLIPTAAISTINLIPGSNPLFGLNTLGGALSIRTRSGAQYPGTQAQLYGGSFGRRAAEAQHGGAQGELDYFASANAFREDGWRAQSPSDVRQLFTKLGWQDGTTDIDISVTHAETDLSGNGLLPGSMVAADPRQAYTLRDNTRNRMTLLSVNATRWLTSDALWSGIAYYRDSGKTTSSGDVNQITDPRSSSS